MSYGVIYVVTNTVNGKCYVGQTTNSVRRRWGGHKKEARDNSQGALHRAIRKYGSEAFSVEVIQECSSREELNQAEQEWVKRLSADRSSRGYNCTSGGDRGFGFSEETREKIAVSVRKTWEGDPSYREKVRAAALKQWGDEGYRKQRSEEAKLLMQDPAKRERLSKIAKGYMRENPEARMALALRNRTPEGRKALSEGMKKRAQDPSIRKLISDAAKKSFLDPGRCERNLKALEAARAARSREWAAVEVVREFIQGMTVREYELKRKAQRDLPGAKLFRSLYGKTFPQVRSGSSGS